MIIVLKPGASEKEIKHLLERVEELGLKHMVSRGVERTIVGVIGEEDVLRVQPLEAFPGVEKVMPVLKPYKLVSREFRPEDSKINIKGIEVGGRKVVVIAGPCSVENKKMLKSIAKEVKQFGALMLRGGAFKPRTSPYAFQGLGEEGLKYLREVGDELDIPIVTEVMDTRDVELGVKYADVIQIGARNMQNFNLLKEVGKIKKAVLLKRGMMATVKELLMSAEYILAQGNFDVILCERGIRTFEDSTRNTLDISAVPVIKRESHLPVFVDPSHATGNWWLVEPVAKAAIAIGADGLIVEVHDEPEKAMSDGVQSLLPQKFKKMMDALKPIAESIGRTV